MEAKFIPAALVLEVVMRTAELEVAVADASGTFAFHRLSPGTYIVKAWSEQSAEPTTSEVVIKAGANELTVAVKADASSQNPDKFGNDR